MPRGIDKIEQLAKEAKARSDAYESGTGFQRALYLKAGQTARGRFLEEGNGVWYLYTHPLPRKPGQQVEDKILCIDQPFSEEEEANFVEGNKQCYGCELEGVSRTARVVINFIRYDEPKLVRDKDKKPMKDAQGNYVTDGVEPALVVCSFATGVGGRISFLESQYGPLSHHVCTIHKTGDKTNPFMIDIVEANKMPPEPWEMALHEKRSSPAKAITSLSPRFMSIPLMSYGDMKRAYSGAAVATGFASDAPTDGKPANMYAQAAQGGQLNPGAFRN